MTRFLASRSTPTAFIFCLVAAAILMVGAVEVPL